MNTHILIDYWQIIAAFLCGFLLAGVLVWIVVWWRRGAAARSGKRGEKAVAKELARLRRKDFIVLNDLLLPTVNDRTSQIDHVVVSTRGVFVIETKNHAGRISGAEQAQYWQQHLSSQSRGFYNPILQNRSHLRAIRRHPFLRNKGALDVLVGEEGAFYYYVVGLYVEAPRFGEDYHCSRTLTPPRQAHQAHPYSGGKGFETLVAAMATAGSARRA